MDLLRLRGRDRALVDAALLAGCLNCAAGRVLLDRLVDVGVVGCVGGGLCRVLLGDAAAVAFAPDADRAVVVLGADLLGRGEADRLLLDVARLAGGLHGRAVRASARRGDLVGDGLVDGGGVGRVRGRV